MKIKELIKKQQEKRKEKDIQNKILKQQEKERIKVHKKMLENEKLRANEERICHSDSFISLQNINKIYPNHVQAVYNFNLEVKEHEFIVFVGPSGCGKSTTLRMIAGLEDITSGDLYIDKVYSNFILPKNRNIAMVFQNYALYPHLTVYENMAFSLKIQNLSNEEIYARIKKTADTLQISDYLNRKPSALSGGQCQRVALGRAIVRNSKLFLMDEPLSNLDAKLRVSMRSEIIKLHENLKATTIYVTHDQTEAMTMATRIVVMNKGYIQQIGTPQEIYNHPSNKFVATFVGSPSMNMINAKIDKNYIIFNNKYKIKLDDSQKNIIKDFYVSSLENAKSELDNLEKNNLEKIELLKQRDSLIKNEEYEEKKKEIDEKILIIDKANVKRTELINIINNHQQIVDSESFEVTFGIRPDDIIEESEITPRINPSKPFTLIANVCELLGNSYYIHTNFADEEIIINLPAYKNISFKDSINVVINLKKYHLFDVLTEKIIY